MTPTATPFPLATALRKSLKGYNAATFKQDAMAAFVVSLVALPLSMALSIAVGLPPQHGLYTAIAAGIITPLLGGAPLQVSGPTAAFVVILAPIVSEHGLRGLIWCSILAGIILLALGFSRLGRLINYVPYPVTTGFTTGIAVVLGTLSLNDLLGLGIVRLEGSYVEKTALLISHLPATDIYETAVGLVTLFFLFYSPRLFTSVPSAIIAMLFGTILGFILTSYGHPIDTIATRFSYLDPQGMTIPGIPPYPPLLRLPGFSDDPLFALPALEEFRALLFPALTIAILAALESLLSATVADSMSGTRHDPNAELNAIGIGNILSGLVAGIPATGAIARTATLINNGGKTPIASSLHALLILLYMVALAQFIGLVPMASLAALLIFTAYRMSHYKQFIRTLLIAPGSDKIVLLTCFLLTVFIDMVAGVGVGMICAAFLLMKRVMEMTSVEAEGEGYSKPEHLPEGVLVYRIRGPLFFGTAEKAFDRAHYNHERVRHFILDVSSVPFIDMTGLVAMKSLIVSVANAQRTMHIIGAKPEIEEKILRKIADLPAGQFVHFHAKLHDALDAQ